MARKKKAKQRDLTPYKAKDIDLWLMSRCISTLNDYRSNKFDQTLKIKTRLFYRGDDLPKEIWVMPIPEGVEYLFHWNAQLITGLFNHRVGIITSLMNQDDEDDEFAYDRYDVIFEDYNDMLMFKLALK
jgi:hypothetical protein